MNQETNTVAGKIAQAGELLIRAAAVLGTLSKEEQDQLHRNSEGKLTDCLAWAIEAAATINPAVRESLRTHPPKGFAALESRIKAAMSAQVEPAECPPGGYYIMIDFEQSAGHCNTLTEARIRGQELCDQEPLPATWSIHDADGKFVENIARSAALEVKKP